MKKTVEGFNSLTIPEGKNQKGILDIQGNSYQEINDIKPSLENLSEIRNCGDSGNINFEVHNKNFLNLTRISEKVNCNVDTENNILKVTTINNVTTYLIFDCNLPIGKYYVYIKSPVSSFNLGFLGEDGHSVLGRNVWSSQVIEVQKTVKEVRINIGYDQSFEMPFSDLYIVAGEEDLGYVDNKEQLISFPLKKGQVLHEGDYLAEDGIHIKKTSYIVTGQETLQSRTILTNTTRNSITLPKTAIQNDLRNYNSYCSHLKDIYNYNLDEEHFYIGTSSLWLFLPTEIGTSALEVQKYLQNQYNNGTPLKIEYELAEEIVEAYSPEQQEVYNFLKNIYLYDGINHIISLDDLSPYMIFTYDKIVNDFDFYLSENNRLVFPKDDISLLCSVSESVIPCMPEARETSATIPGADGDLVLTTNYNAMPFELVVYTDDNLEPEEKLEVERFLNNFCNEIKNKMKTFAIELAQKFYKVKYNGLLERVNYPKHLVFTLPCKSSKSYAYDIRQNYLMGNSSKESNTIEPCGFECIILGPALNPIISLNNYSMEYENVLLENQKLIINTNNSTAILVDSNTGIESNAMRYYNHQFPKIENGENVLKVLSGIDNPNNVFISWNDLVL